MDFTKNTNIALLLEKINFLQSQTDFNTLDKNDIDFILLKKYIKQLNTCIDNNSPTNAKQSNLLTIGNSFFDGKIQFQFENRNVINNLFQNEISKNDIYANENVITKEKQFQINNKRNVAIFESIDSYEQSTFSAKLVKKTIAEKYFVEETHEQKVENEIVKDDYHINRTENIEVSKPKMPQKTSGFDFDFSVNKKPLPTAKVEVKPIENVVEKRIVTEQLDLTSAKQENIVQKDEKERLLARMKVEKSKAEAEKSKSFSIGNFFNYVKNEITKTPITSKLKAEDKSQIVDNETVRNKINNESGETKPTINEIYAKKNGKDLNIVNENFVEDEIEAKGLDSEENVYNTIDDYEENVVEFEQIVPIVAETKTKVVTDFTEEIIEENLTIDEAFEKYGYEEEEEEQEEIVDEASKNFSKFLDKIKQEESEDKEIAIPEEKNPIENGDKIAYQEFKAKVESIKQKVIDAKALELDDDLPKEAVVNNNEIIEKVAGKNELAIDEIIIDEDDSHQNIINANLEIENNVNEVIENKESVKIESIDLESNKDLVKIEKDKLIALINAVKSNIEEEPETIEAENPQQLDLFNNPFANDKTEDLIVAVKDKQVVEEKVKAETEQIETKVEESLIENDLKIKPIVTKPLIALDLEITDFNDAEKVENLTESIDLQIDTNIENNKIEDLKEPEIEVLKAEIPAIGNVEIDNEVETESVVEEKVVVKNIVEEVEITTEEKENNLNSEDDIQKQINEFLLDRNEIEKENAEQISIDEINDIIFSVSDKDEQNFHMVNYHNDKPIVNVAGLQPTEEFEKPEIEALKPTKISDENFTALTPKNVIEKVEAVKPIVAKKIEKEVIKKEVLDITDLKNTVVNFADLIVFTNGNQDNYLESLQLKLEAENVIIEAQPQTEITKITDDAVIYDREFDKIEEWNEVDLNNSIIQSEDADVIEFEVDNSNNQSDTLVKENIAVDEIEAKDLEVDLQDENEDIENAVVEKDNSNSKKGESLSLFDRYENVLNSQFDFMFEHKKSKEEAIDKKEEALDESETGVNKTVDTKKKPGKKEKVTKPAKVVEVSKTKIKAKKEIEKPESEVLESIEEAKTTESKTAKKKRKKKINQAKAKKAKTVKLETKEIVEEKEASEIEVLDLKENIENEVLEVEAEAIFEEETENSIVQNEILESHLNKAVNRDFRKLITVNDRFAFIQSLFDGSYVNFESAVTQINRFNNLDDANNYVLETLAKKYIWDLDNKTFKFFSELITKNFEV